ncbi:MAG: hypothetical protein QOG85_1814 [Gaiellaceae bacterium]|jgi:hypothetical protein|nr:hypothetical protein [Gaiellaceae bacterium]
MERKVLWPVLVIGLALVIAPLALSLSSKTAAGQRMLNDFRPLMTPAHVEATAGYYNNVFVPLGQVATQFGQASQDPKMQEQLKPLMPMLGPAMPIFAKVPAGLAHYGPLVNTMQANVNDYASVDSLPNFNLFTWFFVIPGALLFLLAGYGLWHEHEVTVQHRRHPTPA